jgi:hypothetical protein
MRSFLAFFALSLAAPALAVPGTLLHQGRISDSGGAPLTGTHLVGVSLVASGGSVVWSDNFNANFDNGFFSVALGSGVPLDVNALSDGLLVQLSVDGVDVGVAQSLHSVPFALKAGVATDLRGGTVDATEIRINGSTVIDGSGALSASVAWDDIVGAPDLTDSDTLGELSGCGPGNVPTFDGSAWACAAPAANDDASALTRGTLALSVIPVGTSSSTVAAGDHRHGFDSIDGSLDLARTTGNLDLARTTGNLDIGRVSGNLAGTRLTGAVAVGDTTATCNTAAAGQMKYASGTLSVCNGTRWVAIVQPQLGTQTSPGTSCKQLFDADNARPSAVYWIDPNQGDPSDAFPVHCDMVTAGGGWTRVAALANNFSVCEMTAAQGSAQDVANANGTAWLSAAVVGTIPWTGKEVMLYDSATNWVRYTSTASTWTWANIANGTIGTSNVASHSLTYRKNSDSGFQTLRNGGGCTSGGDCLLGGYDVSNNWTIILGIGAYNTSGSHNQGTCQSTGASWRAMYSGSSWATDGFVYIR